MRQVSADKAYLSDKNLRTVTEKAAMPYIPFKSDNVAHKKHNSPLWNQMYHYFSYNRSRL